MIHENSLTAQIEAVAVNREYNSDVFKAYFSIKKNALELYNALNEADYTDENELQIDTLEKSVFMKIYNDVSFVISGTINLYEHQSTINPNTPLRDLFYVADMFKRTAMKRDLYGRSLVKIPTPKFVVFYNGAEDFEDRVTLKLSDSYLQATDKPDLELLVLVLNVNYGHNRQLLDKCTALREYSIFNQRVRDNLSQGMPIEKAAAEAVESCINDHIMEDFLTKEKAGVIQMHVLDFDQEKHDKELRREGFEDGFSDGFNQCLSQERTAIIRHMSELGKTAEDISFLTGIPLENVLEIQTSLNE